MRIAQVAPLFTTVPPARYGGTERVIHDLTEALVARGHEVTLFASGDSQTSARLVSTIPHAIWEGGCTADPQAAHLRMHAEVFARAGEFDVIHTHTDHFAFAYIAESSAPVVTTLHGRLDTPEWPPLLAAFPDARLISISRAQRAPVAAANWTANVYHGLVLDHYRFDPSGGAGLAFLARMCPEKAPEVAIDLAIAAGVPITLAGRIDGVEREFFEREVRPRLQHPLVTFIGEVDHEQKQRLLGKSRALLFPIDWPEPFGLAMAEAMACGVPVIARPKGAAPEVVVDGVTGFLADRPNALLEAVRAVGRLDRAACRRHVERHFSAARMADQYQKVYGRLVAERKAPRAAPHTNLSSLKQRLPTAGMSPIPLVRKDPEP